jgi:hypothetical protein
VALLAAPATSANAAPNDDNKSSEAPDEHKADTGKDAVLNDVLESSNRKFVQAKAAVAKSTKTQREMAGKVQEAEVARDLLIPEVNAIAAQQYQTGNLGPVSFLLGSNGSNDFLSKAVSLEEINTLHDRKLNELNKAIDEVSARKAALDAEVKAQQNNLAAMKKQKAAADDALSLLGGNAVTKGLVDATSRKATPAPRNSDGGFSAESCSADDPTTGGCVRPRTLHMYKEVKKAGFNRFVGCFRSGGPFEHPKGLACDWSLQERGFASFHNDDMFRYGNDLMAFLVRNADRLGIYYVIWNRKIWFPASGWSAYSGPSAHTDHVHVSML